MRCFKVEFKNGQTEIMTEEQLREVNGSDVESVRLNVVSTNPIPKTIKLPTFDQWKQCYEPHRYFRVLFKNYHSEVLSEDEFKVLWSLDRILAWEPHYEHLKYCFAKHSSAEPCHAQIVCDKTFSEWRKKYSRKYSSIDEWKPSLAPVDHDKETYHIVLPDGSEQAGSFDEFNAIMQQRMQNRAA